MKDTEPKLLAFLCNWGGYAAYDSAGTKQLPLPPIFEVRVMCTGRVDPCQLIDAFLNGCDGVMIVGCRKGECRYETGNYYAETRVYWAKKAFGHIGINPERLHCDWIGSDDCQTFKRIVDEFNEKIRSLGKLPQAEGLEQQEVVCRLKALREVFAGERIRWLIGKALDMAGGTDVFGNPVDKDSFEKEVMDILSNEYERGRILVALKEGPRSVVEIAKMISMKPELVMKEILVLKRQGKLALEGITEGVPQYKSV